MVPCATRADGAVRDPRGRGDVAVGESEPGGARDRLVKGVFCLVPAPGGTLDAPQDFAAQLAASTCLSDAFRVCNRCEWHARRDCGARRVGHSGARGLLTFTALIHQNAQLISSSRGDCLQLR